MRDPHPAGVCSLDSDFGPASTFVTDVSLDFGEGAWCGSCPCGAWVVVNENGTVLAEGEPVEAVRVEFATAV